MEKKGKEAIYLNYKEVLPFSYSHTARILFVMGLYNLFLIQEELNLSVDELELLKEHILDTLLVYGLGYESIYKDKFIDRFVGYSSMVDEKVINYMDGFVDKFSIVLRNYKRMSLNYEVNKFSLIEKVIIMAGIYEILFGEDEKRKILSEYVMIGKRFCFKSYKLVNAFLADFVEILENEVI